ncbi:MAG: hypothetical protein ACW99A_05580 [Candidatus Kariarchaeaceae archaeon]|jgi:hypothetical protein
MRSGKKLHSKRIKPISTNLPDHRDLGEVVMATSDIGLQNVKKSLFKKK